MKKSDLNLKKPQYDDTIEVFIEADENDGDYVSTTTFIDLEDFEQVLPALKKLHANRHNDHSWENRSDYLTEEEISTLEEFGLIPISNTDDGEIHSIEEVEVWFLSSEDTIRYEVKL